MTSVYGRRMGNMASYPIDVSHLLVVLKALTAHRSDEHGRLDGLSGDDLAVEFARKALGLWCDHTNAQRWSECADCSFPRGPVSDPVTPEDLHPENLVPNKWLCAAHCAETSGVG